MRAGYAEAWHAYRDAARELRACRAELENRDREVMHLRYEISGLERMLSDFATEEEARLHGEEDVATLRSDDRWEPWAPGNRIDPRSEM